ncbi:MAG TPA: sorbosone dehydrogenase family protein, partial [Alphaproteobacteria bacterium]|nr:sorbosone dehydrogenase family protein [Alphaproteobacteria bacterium]
MRPALLLAGLTLASPVSAQQSETTDVEIRSHVYKPAQVDATDERIEQLTLPDGFTVTKFVDRIENPRMLAVAGDGTVYATRRDQGDLLMMRDDDRDGQADGVRVVARRPGMHGIAIDGDRMYLATVKEVFAADINDDGTLGRMEA